MSSGRNQTTQQTSANYDQRQVNTDSNNTSFSDYTNSGNTTNTSTTITNLLDGGAIGGGIDAAKSAIAGILSMGSNALDQSVRQTTHAYDYADGIFSASLDAVQSAGNRELKAWERAATVQDVALNTVKSAYADAKGTSDAQKHIVLGVIAVAGVLALSAMKAKG